jgi:hypothetical protein
LEEERKELDQSNVSKFNNFIEQLNNAGARGFKAKASIYYGMPVSIAKLDEGPYEYTWFETTSGLLFAIDGFRGKYEEMSKRGFRLTDHFYVDGSCETLDPDGNLAYGQICSATYLFLLERRKGIDKPEQFVLADTFPTRSGKHDVELSNQLSEKLAGGFYPTDVFTRTQILLHRIPENNDLPGNNLEVQVVASSFLKNEMKKVNELAKQGYRLALINNETAVMYRNKDNATPVTYFWVKAKSKALEENLATLQKSGAVYRMVYRDDHNSGHRLVFEQKLGGEGIRHEYRVLKFEFQFTENAREKRVYIDLTPSSKESIKTLNRLATEGFVVRDLFIADRVSVLLERLVP